MAIFPVWVSNAPFSYPVPSFPEELAEEIASFRSRLCESCRARSLEPMCPPCFEMALRELEAQAEEQGGEL